MSSEGRLLASFSKNRFEEIRIVLREWEGKEYVDLRVYEQSEKPGMEPRATGKGFCMRSRLFSDFVMAIEAAKKALGELGQGGGKRA